MKYIFCDYFLLSNFFGFATIKESFKTFARERKGTKQIAAFFYSMRNWWSVNHRWRMSSIKAACVGPNVEGSVGWMEDEQLKICFFCGPAGFHVFLSFSLKTVFRGRKKNNDSRVFNLQIVRKRKQWPWSKFLFFHSYLYLVAWMPKTTEGAQTVCAPPSITKFRPHKLLQTVAYSRTLQIGSKSRSVAGWGVGVIQPQKGFFCFSCSWWRSTISDL